MSLENHGQRVDLVVRNNGQTAAADLKVQFTPQPAAQADNFSQVVSMLTDEGVSFLAPGRELLFYYGIGSRLLSGDYTTRFIVTASYVRADHLEAARISDPPYIIDFGRLDQMLAPTPDIDKLIEQLKVATKALNNIERAVTAMAVRGEDASESPD